MLCAALILNPYDASSSSRLFSAQRAGAWLSGWRCYEMVKQSCDSMLSAFGDGQDGVEDGFVGARHLHFLQESGEATLTRLLPAVDLGDDAGQGECRQVETQRFQHTDDDRLPACSVNGFAG